MTGAGPRPWAGPGPHLRHLCHPLQPSLLTVLGQPLEPRHTLLQGGTAHGREVAESVEKGGKGREMAGRVESKAGQERWLRREQPDATEAEQNSATALKW